MRFWRNTRGRGGNALHGCRPHKVLGIDCFVSRSGYTGEDGFEISVPAKDAELVATTLLADPAVLPIGLGARDSLRLEAGLCLYGHDIDTTTTPLKARWNGRCRKAAALVGTRAGGFPGADIILKQVRDRVQRAAGSALRAEGRAPGRENAALYADATSSERIGTRHIGRLRANAQCAGRHGLPAHRSLQRRHHCFRRTCADSDCRCAQQQCPSFPTDTNE